MIQTQENGEKPHFRSHIGSLGIRAANFFLFFFFFSKILFRQSLDIMVSYHQVQYLKKLMIQFSEGRTDRQTDRQKDESDFIGRCSTNVERPKIKKKIQNKISEYRVGFLNT